MPRLTTSRPRTPRRGYRDSQTLNAFDCVRFSQPEDRTQLKQGRLSLFGSRNIFEPPAMYSSTSAGWPIFTNIQVPYMLECDQTSIITNWYARTNIPYDTPARSAIVHEFMCATTATLKVGDKPKAQWSLADLWNRRIGDRIGVGNDEPREGQPGAYDQPKDDAYEDRVALLARDMFMEVDLDHSPERWDDLDDGLKSGYRRAAILALDHLKPPRCWIVPVRQLFSVVIDTSPRAVNKLYELMPKDIAPEPCLWIHLDGFSRRDVA